MSVLYGETGKLEGTFKKFNIALKPYEVTLSSTLPTAKPSTPQVSITYDTTFKNSYNPLISPSSISFKPIPLLYACGDNPTAGQITLNYDVWVNGVSKNTGSGNVASTYKWAYSWFQNSYNLTDGDTIQIYLWASVAGVNFTYYTLQIAPSRIDFGNSGILRDVSYTLDQTMNALTYLNIGSTWMGNYYIQPTNAPDNQLNTAILGLSYNYTSDTNTVSFLKVHNTTKMGYIQAGETQAFSNVVSNATKYNIYQCNYPTVISFRESKR